jgi:multiple sugar transport system permease protein
MKRRFTSVALHLALIFCAVLSLIPLVWMILASLMPTGEASSEPPPFFPSHVTFEHYGELFVRLNLGRVLFNSALLATTVTALSVLLNAMAGYAFAKLRFPGRGRIFAFLLGALVLPSQVAILPLFLLMRQLGLVSSYWGVILPGMATIFGIFLVRQYALSIPDELLDAARIDGAGEARIFAEIIFPLCRPILVTLAIFTFLGTWNDFFWPLVVLTDDSKYTLPVALANLFGEHVQDTELMMAGSVLTVMPVLLLFLFLQRHYVQGLLMGSVKE